jgi:hypothetical protein
MRRTLPIALILLTGCNAELPKEKVELFAAVALITWGMEEGNNKFSAERVDRKVSSDTVEYVIPPSKFDGMSLYVRSPRECVFDITTTPPKGQPRGMSQTINFNKATSFELEFMDRQEMSFPMVSVEGPQVYCERDNCQDEKGFLVLEFRGDMDADARRALALRRMRAIDYIKKSCPGKPWGRQPANTTTIVAAAGSNEV